jgi:LacI family transcriptional regulator
MIAGYEQTMASKGLSEFTEVVVRGDDNVDDQLRGILTRPRKVDAIICDADIVALKIIMSAFMLGISIPEELSVVGMYNTPWCEESPVKISSVGFNEDKIARKAVELIAADKWESEIVTIEPEIMERRSA